MLKIYRIVEYARYQPNKPKSPATRQFNGEFSLATVILAVIPLRNMTRLLFILAPLLVAIGCNSNGVPDQYDAAVKSFALGTPTEETTAAIKLVESAGTDAFDSLLDHLDDKTRASDNHFMRAMVTIDENGNAGPYEPTIGDASFDILQGQIEGVWPKAYRDHYILNRSNIRDWLQKRDGKSLHELRLECAKSSLESAKSKHEQHPTDWSKSCVEFVAENLTDVQAEPKDAG